MTTFGPISIDNVTLINILELSHKKLNFDTKTQSTELQTYTHFASDFCRGSGIISAATIVFLRNIGPADVTIAKVVRIARLCKKIADGPRHYIVQRSEVMCESPVSHVPVGLCADNRVSFLYQACWHALSED